MTPSHTEIKRATVEVLGITFAVEFTIYKDEQVHIRHIYDGEREVSRYTTQEVKDQIEGYLMHHYTNHIA